MANDLYQFVQQGLTSLVSPRAARRLLSGALRSRGYQPETVSAEEMQGVLLGPLSDELKRNLPSSVVAWRLQQLGRQALHLYAAESAEAEASPRIASASPSGPPETVEAQPITQTSVAVLEPLPEVPVAVASPRVTDALEPNPEPWSPARLEAAALRFAALEHIAMIAVLSRQGEVLLSRGGDDGLAAISRLASLGWRLLGRRGALRSYYLSQADGQLFLFPLGAALLAVVGSPKVNVGLVFTTLQKVKEDV